MSSVAVASLFFNLLAIVVAPLLFSLAQTNTTKNNKFYCLNGMLSFSVMTRRKSGQFFSENLLFMRDFKYLIFFYNK